MADGPWYDGVVLPALLRAARSTYRDAVSHSLDRAGFSDLPRRGALVIGGIARNGPTTVDDLRLWLRRSDAYVAQLLDKLEDLGYVHQAPHGEGVLATLTDRGRAAATVTRQAVEATDAALIQQVGDPGVNEARRVLGALVALRTGGADGAN